MHRSLHLLLPKTPTTPTVSRVRPRSRSRLAAIQSNRGADLGLDFFLKRSKSLSLYRDFIRLITQIKRVSGDDAGEELRGSKAAIKFRERHKAGAM